MRTDNQLMSSTIAQATGDEAGSPAASDQNSRVDASPASRGLHQNPALRQFLKFCIVGASSTTVQFVVLNVCYRVLRLPLFTSLTAAFMLSVCNAFFWNRRWTFKEARANSAREQSVKFLGVNLVGYLLNTTIVALVVAHFSARGGLMGGELKAVVYNILAGEGKQHYAPLLVNGAQATATCIVVWWNFFANRLWTFKR